MPVKKTSTLLIVAALLTGMSACVSPPAAYTLTISSTEGGEIAPLGEGTFTCEEGEIVELVATPATGYRFVGWSGDVDGIHDIAAPCITITVRRDCSIRAVFAPVWDQRYNLTVSSSVGGSVTNPGEGTFAYEVGARVSLAAKPATGYRFAKWTGDVGTVANVYAAETTIIMNGNYSIAANFEVVRAEQYHLTVSSSEGGSVTTPGEGTFLYNAGAVVNLVAAPAPGHRFVNWSGDVNKIGDVNAASTTITMSANCSITANFQPIPTVRYNLTITSAGGGLVTSPGIGTFTYDAGTVVSLLARPTCVYQYQFVNWTGDVGTVANVNAASTTIVMNGNYSIRANFAAIPLTGYILSISSSAGGSVTTPGEGTFLCVAGTVVSLVATPASGYQFVNWTGDVGTIANVNSSRTTVTMSGSYSIRANFQAIQSGRYSLTISSSAGGSVTRPGEGTFTYDAGTVVSLTATSAAGYRFVNWTGDVGGIANVNAASTTVTMNGNYLVMAVFAADSPSPPGMGYTEAEAEALIIALVNGQRQQNGLSALSEDALLASLAKEHSISMVVNSFFSHERYPGERSFTYGQLPGTIRGENIAMIPTRQYTTGPYLSLQQVCEWAVSLWMNSAGHRANILKPNYTRTGVGVAFSQGGDYLYITQMFEGYY